MSISQTAIRFKQQGNQLLVLVLPRNTSSYSYTLKTWRSFFLSVFFRIPTKYGGMPSIFPVSILGKLVIWWKSYEHFLIVPAQENLHFFCLLLLSESGISCYSLVSYSGNKLSVKRLKSLCQKSLLCKVI